MLPLTLMTSENWYVSQNFFPYFYHLHRWHWKNYSNPNFFFVFFAIDTVDIWINLNMSKKNIKSTVRWLSDAAVDIVNNKKLIHQPIFFTVIAVDIIRIFYIQFFFRDGSMMLFLTPLTWKNWYVSQCFFLCFYSWHCWHQKNHSNPNLILYFAIDTIDIWKNMNLSKKNLKSTVRWLSDAAVDAVDIRNWFVSQFVFVFLPLTLLTSQKLFTSKFFSLLYCWHCWHLKKHEYVKEKLKKHC